MRITFILKEKCRSPWVVLRNLRLEVGTLIPALASEFTLLVVVAHNTVRLILEHLQWHTNVRSGRPEERDKTYAESVLRIHTHKGSIWQMKFTSSFLPIRYKFYITWCTLTDSINRLRQRKWSRISTTHFGDVKWVIARHQCSIFSKRPDGLWYWFISASAMAQTSIMLEERDAH